jgi:Asp-tRNA(Asn)/Glu-tRNA(Gln) amidotransferase A subunit family amidase
MFYAMRNTLLAACLSIIATFQLNAQDTISKTDIKAASKLFDVSFTDPEVDSMYLGVLRNVNTIRRMHKAPLPNDVPMTLWQMPLSPEKMQAAGKAMPANSASVKIPAGVSLPANRNELAFYTIPQLASLIKDKKISSVELTRFYLDRLKKYGDSLECVVSLTEDIALQQAKTADSLLAKGTYLGMLHGIPYGLKDLFAVKGTKTTWGAAPYKDQVIEADAYVYTKLREAGAVLIAKLTLGALAQGDYWFGGRTRSPWNTERGSSGSSAGSAAATVAGLVPFAIGTETWGSIISPSTACGASGLRPTFGSISRSGAMTLSWSLDKAGPICRSAEDAAIVFAHIRGTDELDGIPAPVPFAYNPSADIKKLKIGYAKNYFDRMDSTRNEWKVLEAFRKMGIEPQPMTFPDDSTVWPFSIMDLIINAECAAAFDEFTRSGLDDQMTRQNRNDWPNSFRTARMIPAVEYINANRHRAKLTRAIIKAMSEFDVVITPSFGGNQVAITNLTGHPAMCVPAGFDKRAGLPTSITFLGNLWGEAQVLLAAKAFQQVTEWEDMRPPAFK